MFFYFSTKFQVSSTILANFRFGQGGVGVGGNLLHLKCFHTVPLSKWNYLKKGTQLKEVNMALGKLPPGK